MVPVELDCEGRLRLLVLGAGRPQLGLLQAARRRGLLVIAVDRDPGAPGFQLAERRALISFEDEPAIHRLAERRLDGRERPTRASVKRVLELRETLRELLIANNEHRTEPGAAETLRHVADRARLTLELDEHGQLALAPQAPGVDGALGRILAVVHEAMAEGNWHRLKACRECAWAYYDYSKNRSATWCSMAICGNRTKTRAYRRRRSGNRQARASR